MNKLKSLLPIIDSINQYSSRWFKGDFIAGLTVAIILVPQGMAYAYLAGMPLIYGLYAGLLPLFTYSVFSSSRHLSIGPVAISALLVFAGISQLAEPGTPEYVSLVISTGFWIGLLQITIGIFRLGFLINFLSRPIIAGFTSAAAVIIFISQLKDLLGFNIPHFEYPIETFMYAWENLSNTNWIASTLCLGSMLIMTFLKKINPIIPGALISVILSTLACWLFKLPDMGIKIIGAVPEGLPMFFPPDTSFETLKLIWPTVLSVNIIGIVESVGMAKALESKQNEYRVKPNQELFALGFSKLIGAFFQAMPSSGSLTRSAVNHSSGGKTQFSSFITCLFILLTLLFFTELFFFLPKAILAAIVLLAVFKLFDYKEAIFLAKTDKSDLLMMGITFFTTLLIGIEAGVLAGTTMSILYILYRSSKPNLTVIGNVPGTSYYRDIDRFEIVEQDDDILIIRFDNQLYFGNADYFKNEILDLINQKEGLIKYLFLETKSMHDIDSTGLHALEELFNVLNKKGIQLYLSGSIGRVRDMIIKAGLREKIGNEFLFHYLNDAVESCKQNK